MAPRQPSLGLHGLPVAACEQAPDACGLSALGLSAGGLHDLAAFTVRPVQNVVAQPDSDGPVGAEFRDRVRKALFLREHERALAAHVEHFGDFVGAHKSERFALSGHVW